MANLPESSTFDAGVYQIELSDPVIGGPAGVSNAPLKNLANRTKYLKDHVDALESTRAPLASPALTGTPTAPTAAADTNTTQVATTAFIAGQAGTVTPAMNGTAAVGTSLKYARGDHVHPTDTSRAPLASPALTGTPTAPTQPTSDDSTKLATTAWVRSALLSIATAAGFSYTYGAAGYIKLPSWLGGFIIQWGSIVVPAGTGGTFTYPISFPNAALSGVATKNGSYDPENLTLWPGKSNAGIDNYPGAVDTPALIIVIGY